MTTPSIPRTLLILALLCLAPLAALAAADTVSSLSSGVGKDERVARADYSLLLTFAEAKGPYIAQVKVEIRAAAGKTVLQAESEGPWLFVNLPPGDYKVVATRANGAKTSATFTIGGGKQHTVRLSW